MNLVDALRGFALAGVLMVNLNTFTLYEYLDKAARQQLPTADFDRLASLLVGLLVNNKAVR